MGGCCKSRSGCTRAFCGLGIFLALVLFALPLAAYMKWVDWPWIGPPEKLRLAAYEGDVGALEWIAKDFGFYDKAGIDVDIKGYPSGSQAVAALRAGEVDIATASEFVVATDSLSDPSLRILSSICYYWNKGIVARRDRGIAAAADLRGKRIAVTIPSGAEYSLSIFLALNRMTTNDVVLVNLPPAQLVEAVVEGTVDAAITWQPHVRSMEKTLDKSAIGFGGEGFDVYLLLVSQAEKIPGSERALKRLLRALLMAEDWARTHPDEAKAYIAKRFSVDPAYAEAQWRRMQLAISLPQEILVAMDNEARWLARRDGKAEADFPNFAKIVHADELKAVKPSAVTVLSAQAPEGPGLAAAIARQ